MFNRARLHGATDGGVGPPARTVGAGGTVHPQLFTDGAVDDEEGRAGVGGGLDGVKVERWVAHGGHAGHDDGQVLGQAASHYRVDGQAFNGGVPPVGGKLGHHMPGGQGYGGQHGLDPLRCGRRDGQAVAPAPFQVVVLEGVVVVGQDNELGFQLDQQGPPSKGKGRQDRAQEMGKRRVSPSTMVSKMESALATAVSTATPPMGCGATAIGRSGIPREHRSTLPRRWKRWLHTVTVGTPRRSSSTASWILHEVQEPQSPRPTTATSTVAANSSITCGSAGMDAVGLRR